MSSSLTHQQADRSTSSHLKVQLQGGRGGATRAIGSASVANEQLNVNKVSSLQFVPHAGQ